MEDIATNNIKTIVAKNTVFIDELKKTKSDSDGFTHDYKSGNKCELENGSKINAIAGSSRSARGRRSNINVYDEAGFISGETFDSLCNKLCWLYEQSGYRETGIQCGIWPPIRFQIAGIA